MKFEFTIDIPAPLPFVWQIAQDTSLRPKWDPRIATYEVDGPKQTGTPVRFVVRALWFRPVMTGQFARFDPPHQSIMKVDTVSSALFPVGGGTWLFSDRDGVTVWTTRFTLKYPDERSILEWLAKPVVMWDTWRAQRRFRSLVLKLYSQEHA